MTDEEFLRALESCRLPECAFGHAGHVRAAYLYLRCGNFARALDDVSRAIRNFATYHGKPDRYHETVTVAYVALIQEHLRERGDGGGWPGFAQANPELVRGELLAEFYPPGQLDSPRARSVFLLPRAAGIR